jgi:perosamine synthetase
LIKIAEPSINEEEIKAVVEVLRSGNFREGEKCYEFEQQFATMVGGRYATALSSGTAALHTAYVNTIQPGDEVLVPGFTFFATASMVVWARGVPVFCDIDPRTYCIDLNDAKRKVTARTRAIAPVHLFGNACDIDGVITLASEHELKIIWDAAQAHLTKYKGKDVGSYDDAVCYSMYATKNMTTGEGGMIVSNDKDFIDRCAVFKRQGQEKKYYHTVLGTNYRMTDMQGAIGLCQLGKIESITARRRENAAYLNEGLRDLSRIMIQFVPEEIEHSYHQYVVCLGDGAKDRSQVIEGLKKRGIGSAVHYPIPLHKQPPFEKLHGNTFLPISEKIARQCLSLPVHPALTKNDLERILDGVRETLG